MSKHREDYLVQCPYYREEERQTIHCEGVQSNTGLRLGFSGARLLQDYKDRFCRDGWCGCMIAKMLNAKYDYEP